MASRAKGEVKVREWKSGRTYALRFAAWVVGGVLLRVGGLVLALGGGFSGLVLFGQVGGVLTTALGALLWLAGHWHYALRHQRYKTPRARRLFAARLRHGSTRPASASSQRRPIETNGIRPIGEKPSASVLVASVRACLF